MGEPAIIDLGSMSYEQAWAIQNEHVARVIEARTEPYRAAGTREVILFVEHDPVITISKRAGARDHLVATDAMLADHGVAIAQTDRGGDITYHGPGQIVCYPILDLTARSLRLHAYLRLLEEAVIATIGAFGVQGGREAKATGVWVPGAGPSPASKIAAMGVRVRRWVTLHGLALNVTTNLAHFDLIVPCGLAGRTVTSLHERLGSGCPSMVRVRAQLGEDLIAQLRAHDQSRQARSGAVGQSS